MSKQIEIPDIRVITVSGRIASGATTLAKKLAEKLNWKHIEGGEIIWQVAKINKLKAEVKDTNKRADKTDIDFDESLKKILKTQKNIVLETKLAGFNAQGIDKVFKILVVCNDEKGVDQTAIRIDRLVNREKVSVEKAKEEVLQREKNDIEKWVRLYGKEDKNWTYWNKQYYDLVINTYFHDKEESLKLVLEKISKE